MHARMLSVVVFSPELSTVARRVLLPHASGPMDGHVAMNIPYGPYYR